MKKQFVSYPIALALYELGFDEKCFGYFKFPDTLEYEICSSNEPNMKRRGIIAVPTWQQVEEWLREKHSLFIEIDLTDNTCAKYYQYCIVDSDDREYDDEEMIDQASHIYNFKDKYETYPKAREAAILQAIEIIKNK